MARMKLKTIVQKLAKASNERSRNAAAAALKRVTKDEIEAERQHASSYVASLWKSCLALHAKLSLDAASKILEFMHASATQDDWLQQIGNLVLPALYDLYRTVLSSFRDDETGKEGSKVSLTVSPRLQAEAAVLHFLSVLLDLVVDCCDLTEACSSQYLCHFVKVTSAILFGTKFNRSKENLEPGSAYECDVLQRNASIALANIIETCRICRDLALEIFCTRQSQMVQVINGAPEATIQRSLIRVAKILFSHDATGEQMNGFKTDMTRFLKLLDRENFRQRQWSKPMASSAFGEIDLTSCDAYDKVEQFRGILDLHQRKLNPGVISCIVMKCHIYAGLAPPSSDTAFKEAMIDWNLRSLAIKSSVLAGGQAPVFIPYTSIESGMISTAWKEVELKISSDQIHHVVIHFDQDLSQELQRKLHSHLASFAGIEQPGDVLNERLGSESDHGLPQIWRSRKVSTPKHSQNEWGGSKEASQAVPYRQSDPGKSNTDGKEVKSELEDEDAKHIIHGPYHNSVFSGLSSEEIFLAGTRSLVNDESSHLQVLSKNEVEEAPDEKKADMGSAVQRSNPKLDTAGTIKAASLQSTPPPSPEKDDPLCPINNLTEKGIGSSAHAKLRRYIGLKVQHSPRSAPKILNAPGSDARDSVTPKLKRGTENRTVAGALKSKGRHELSNAVAIRKSSSQGRRRISCEATARKNRNDLGDAPQDHIESPPALGDVSILRGQDEPAGKLARQKLSRKRGATKSDRVQIHESTSNELKRGSSCPGSRVQDVRRRIEFERVDDIMPSDTSRSPDVSTTAATVSESLLTVPQPAGAEDFSVLQSGRGLYQNVSKGHSITEKRDRENSESDAHFVESRNSNFSDDRRKNVATNDRFHDPDDAGLRRKLREFLESHLSPRAVHDAQIIADAQSQSRDIIRCCRRDSAARYGQLMAVAADLRSRQIAKLRKAGRDQFAERTRCGKNVEALVSERRTLLSQVHQGRKKLTVLLDDFEDTAKDINRDCHMSLDRIKCIAAKSIQKVSKADTLMTGISNLLGTIM